MIYTSETVCQCNSSETAQQNLMKLVLIQKVILCRCSYFLEILNHPFLVSHAPFELRNFAKIKCTSEKNVTQMWQLLIEYMYLIITDIWLQFSVRLPIIYAWHCYSLCAALSSNVGVWDMWACSLFLSFVQFFT